MSEERVVRDEPLGTPLAVEGVDLVVRPNGPADAAILASGIGILVLGLMTTIAEASTGFADALQWSDRVGPLSGKTIIATASFFGSWAILAALFRRTSFALRTVTIVAAVLIVLGLILTFPTFFEAFAPE